jgi:hypothetical protein
MAEQVADTLSAVDTEVGNMKVVDILAVVDMKAAMDKESLDTVTALYLMLHIDYMD